MSGNERQCKVGSFILEYVERELAFVNEGESHNASSDPVESIFGVVKSRMSDDKLAGVTPIILMMPLRLNLADKGRRVNFNFKQRLEEEDTVTLRNGRMKTLLQIWWSSASIL